MKWQPFSSFGWTKLIVIWWEIAKCFIILIETFLVHYLTAGYTEFEFKIDSSGFYFHSHFRGSS